MIQKTLFAGIVVGHQPQPGASQLFKAGELAGDQGQEENCERRLDCEKYSGLSFKWKKNIVEEKQILVRYPDAQRGVLPEVPWRVWEPAGESEFSSRALHP